MYNNVYLCGELPTVLRNLINLKISEVNINENSLGQCVYALVISVLDVS